MTAQELFEIGWIVLKSFSINSFDHYLDAAFQEAFRQYKMERPPEGIYQEARQMLKEKRAEMQQAFSALMHCPAPEGTEEYQNRLRNFHQTL